MISASWHLSAQEADTLDASAVYSVKALPVVKASEEADLQNRLAVLVQVADVLRLFTGVQVKDYGGAGGLKTVNVRSLGSEHVGVFLDGIQVDNAQNMQVDLGRFSTDGIGTVSLYNGQKTRRLQTAKEYAAGASVHLDSEVPEAGQNGGRVRLSGGSFGTVQPAVSLDHGIGPVTLRFSTEFLSSNGRYRYPCFDTTLVRENGDIKSLRLETLLFGRLQRGDWRLRLYSYGSERGFPGPVLRRAVGFPFSAERQADQDLFVQGAWQQEWTDRYATALRFKYSNNYTHYATHPEKNPMALPYDLHYRQQSVYGSLAQSFVLSNPWSVDLSTDVQYNGLESDVGQFVRPRRISFTGAFATRAVWKRFRAAAHLAYLGAWDYYLSPAAGGWSREKGFRDAWMPSVCLYYSPLEWLEIDAFAKRSYRLPSFNDLYYSQMGNANLEPESAIQTGAGINLKRALRSLVLCLRISPYYNRVEDKIVALPTSSQFRWTMLNIGIVDVTGMDAKATAEFSKGDLDMEMTFRYTFQQALDHTAPGSLTWGNQIPYVPLHSGSINLLAGWRLWRFTWETLLTGERWSRTANIPDYHIDAWSISNAALSREIPLGTKRKQALNLGLCFNNVFNRSYDIVQGYPMPGFNFKGTIGYSW